MRTKMHKIACLSDHQGGMRVDRLSGYPDSYLFIGTGRTARTLRLVLLSLALQPAKGYYWLIRLIDSMPVGILRSLVMPVFNPAGVLSPAGIFSPAGVFSPAGPLSPTGVVSPTGVLSRTRVLNPAGVLSPASVFPGGLVIVLGIL